MRIRVRDVTNTAHYATLAVQHFTDAQSRVLIDGVITEQGEWLAPQAIVGITMIPEPLDTEESSADVFRGR